MEIRYIDRSDGRIKTEKVPGGKMLRWLYGSALGKLPLEALIKQRLFSSLGGWYMNRKNSIKNIEPFVNDHGIDLDEYIVPDRGFAHFNDFFYRKIKPESRPLEDGLVSPADGKILVFSDIKKTQEFFIKGQAFDLSSFLGNRELAAAYNGGAMAIVRLAPPDYHRFHFPCSGTAGKKNRIKGAYYSVSPIALRKSLSIFVQNKREYTLLDSDDYGRVLIMDIGATLTGSIIQTYPENSRVKKGQEKGYFAFGGSTTVLLFEKDKVRFDPDLIQNTANGFETTVLMGQTIGH